MRRYRDAAIGLSILVTAATAIALSTSAINRVETGQNLPHVDWLPDDATNVSFSRTYSWEYYEFDISEAAFKKWASHWQLNEIQEPFYITRYTINDSPSLTDTYDGPRQLLITRGIQLPAQLSNHTAEIRHGLMYFLHNDRTHGGTYVAFDRTVGRAYFHYHAR